MIKQIKSTEVKKYIEENPETVLLDVRTENELNSLGKPKVESYNSKTYFITVSHDLSKWQESDPKFVENVSKKINKSSEVLVMCAAGGRSMIAAELLQKAGFNAHNISDGFNGNGQDPGWKNSSLPTD
jgi:rhodanese-related sulfurtransferase